jgi:hypothetical protein
MAEVEISGLTEQCLGCRMGSPEIIADEIGAWESERKALPTLWLPGARKEAKPAEAHPVEPRVRPDRARCGA